MEGTAVITAAFLFSIGLGALFLVFYTVRRMHERVDKFRIEFAAGFIRFSFEASTQADRDDPEVIDALTVREHPSIAAKEPAVVEKTTAIEGGGAT